MDSQKILNSILVTVLLNTKDNQCSSARCQLTSEIANLQTCAQNDPKILAILKKKEKKTPVTPFVQDVMIEQILKDRDKS